MIRLVSSSEGQTLKLLLGIGGEGGGREPTFFGSFSASIVRRNVTIIKVTEPENFQCKLSKSIR
jgi:hypothetical protein